MDATNSQLLELLCEEHPFTRAEAWELIRSAPKRYKVHFIEKRNGRGRRLIAQPTAELKTIQRWIVNKFIAPLPVHDVAMAYRPGKNIADHARSHAGNKYLLKIDFKDFFPSIRARDFTRHIVKHLGVNTRLASELALLLFRKDENKRLSLSIGAPSSPSISNTLMYEFDCKLSEYCKENEITYTRYADDLALSTNKPHQLDKANEYIRELLNCVKYPRIMINPEKTVFTSKKFQRQLTGLILSSEGKVSLGRERKRLIRVMADHYRKEKLDPNLHTQLKGWLAFSLSVEPDFVRNIRALMGEEYYSKLISIDVKVATEQLIPADDET
ncbi:RNA-directed DNA polymerase [Duganella sp. FT109W]|uniref:RNA-directed DNA polymerase n=1 Tax=Duganella margarita TaxID=2692170 RepID=A0ABW9WC30_9BURK|nr:retron St85 family RNA-directed DNA polymerase [Duganella margarita]MYN37999.1 RNA-directed DNA polymerase [Duganella margarita]